MFYSAPSAKYFAQIPDVIDQCMSWCHCSGVLPLSML